MGLATRRRAPRLRLTAVVATALVLAPACAQEKVDLGPTFEESLDPAPPRDPWCDEYESLDLPGDASELDPTAAPEELIVLLQFLGEMEESESQVENPDPLFDEPSAPLIEAMALMDAWGRTHCGTPHPFCRLWTFVEAHFAAGRTSLQVMSQIDDEMVQYSPDEHIDAVKDYLVLRFGEEGRPVPNDYDERDGRAAIRTLDEWASSSC
jgi:hypothetical protein